MRIAADIQLAEEVAKYYADPEGFVLFAFPWGEKGPLAGLSGPRDWQREILREIGDKVRRRAFDGATPVLPIREAVASGHGIGKSTLVAWIVCWLLSTRPGSKGTVTANTFTQLRTKTWAAIQTWMARCVTRHWFETGAEMIRAVSDPTNWFASAQTCREENSEAFAGQHAADSSSWYVMDEASAIPEKIWEVAEGGLTDGEPHIYAFGNPTRNTGKFWKICFGPEKSNWSHRSIDARTVPGTNRALQDEWIRLYGEDSDYVRVRVLGLPPRASELQFIDQERIYRAQQAKADVLDDEPLIAGLDVAFGGSNWTCFWFRRGRDARSIPPILIPGEKSRDREPIIAKAAQLLTDQKLNLAMLFVDSAFGGPIVERLHAMGHRRVIEVVFGDPASDQTHYANRRAEMWGAMRDWLERGAIPQADEQLEQDLMGPGYHLNRRSQIVLEPKEEMNKRGIPSPDRADALALTFAALVAPRPRPNPDGGILEYDEASYGLGWMA